MSDDMAVGDNATGEEAKLNGDDAAPRAADAEGARSEPPSEPAPQEGEESAPRAAGDVNFHVTIVQEELDNKEEEQAILDEPPPEATDDPEERPNIKPPPERPVQDVPVEDQVDGTDRGTKRKASEAFSDGGDEFKGFGDAALTEEEFKGFEVVEEKDLSMDYSRVLERLEAEVEAGQQSYTPLKTVVAMAIPRASKRLRQDTDGSRPSSALSSRSDGEGALSNDGTSAAGSPANRRRATTEMSSPLLRVPLERGWKRELVYRAALDAHSRRNADIYYYTPQGKKLRSTREVAEHLSGTGLTLDNFSFFKEPLGMDDPEKEIIRDAKLMRKAESPVTSAPPSSAVVEGKRTPKPKPPKGVSPEPAAIKSPPAKIKVKSMGSRLSTGGSGPGTGAASKPAGNKKTTDNNNSAAWKKPSDEKRTRGRAVANGAASPAVTDAMSRRGRRHKPDDTDHFTALYNTAKKHNYNVVVQIFQYVGMRELAVCARVCRLWRALAATPALWAHVRMKNQHVSDWGGLCAALKRHGCVRLDLRKMLLPPNDAVFWQQFAQHIPTVDTLERIEMCRCPASAVEAVCRGLPNLKSLSALAIRDPLLDPSPLGALKNLNELRIKSMSGLTLTRDLRPLAALTNLHHLSLTSIKKLGSCASDIIGQLQQLESLELGECTFRAEFAAVLSRLRALRRLRLERGTADCAAPQILRVLATLPLLTRLELVNIDVKVGFDEALAACTNIQRLLIIPTYVSQSATTNKQVLSGVLRLKDTLTHLMWGVTIELLRVTELFIDQCEQAGEPPRRDLGECIPVLKPVPGCKLPDHQPVQGPPQVEILPLPTLQRLLSTQLPHTKLKLLRIPFHATWRQSLADFQ
ncbi:hypothetical protein O0L34_g3551 [Tuta absoluta]|nr:hypothetical protein O0L34_g3551 [Tuta absoluta]